LIDGEEIDLTVEDMERTIRVLPDEIKTGVLKDPERLKTMMLSTYITKVAAFRAEKKDLDKLPNIVDRLWNRKINFLAVAEIDNVVQQSSSQDFDRAAKEHYLANPEQYLTTPKVDASHILIGLKERNPNEAELFAKNLLVKIQSGVIDFESAAVKYSDDKGSAKNAGSLGEFTKGSMVPPFDDAVFAIVNSGEIVGPIKTNYGYHIIRLNKKIPQKKIPFEEVKSSIVASLAKSQRAAIREEYLLKIQKDAEMRMDVSEVNEFLGKVVVSEEK
jgi:parvulin-like peptidyl-prolyl isomerase